MADTEENSSLTISAKRARLEAFFKFLIKFSVEQQRPPTLRDVVRARVGKGTPGGPISGVSTVSRYLKALEEEGRITLEDKQGSARPARGLRIKGLRCVYMRPDLWQRLDALLKVEREEAQGYDAQALEIETIRKALGFLEEGGDDG